MRLLRPRFTRAWFQYAALIATTCAVIVYSSQPASGASAATTVSLDVMSATSLNVTGCMSGAAGSTLLGTMLPGSTSASTVDCTVAFGSSNNSSQLRIGQTDQLGTAMWRETTAALDTSFGSPNGWAYTGGVSNESGVAIAQQPDGKLVTVTDISGSHNFVIGRFLLDGTLDPTFDGDSGTSDGRVTIARGSATYVSDIMVQSDGKIVVAFSGQNVCSDFGLLRLLPTGQLDTTFDGDTGTGNGLVENDLGLSCDEAISVIQQADGKLIAVGNSNVGGEIGITTVRYNVNGTLDATWDGPSGTGNGVSWTNVGAGPATTFGYVALSQSDGTLLVAGTRGDSNEELVLARLASTGALDTSFGAPNGWSALGVAGSFPRVVDIDTDMSGNIFVLAEHDPGPNEQSLVAKFGPSGVLDTAGFNSPLGYRTHSIVGDRVYPEGMSTQPDGDIVVGAYQYVNDDLLTFRYLSNGALDTSLDGDGVRANQLDNSTQTLDFIETFDGSYAAVGQSWTSSPYRTVVSRIGSVNVPDYLDNGTADWDTGGTSTALFGACLRAVSGGATASWTTNAACTQNDGLHWNDIPSATDKIAFAASPEPDPADASAHIRFGVRSTSSQPPGAYFAPISFEVLAPNA